MSYDDYLKACGWGWYMRSLHFFGWSRILAIELKKKYNITHRQFYDDLFNWFMQNSLHYCTKNIMRQGIY